MTKNIAIIGVLFFVFGFVTWVNAILIPFFKIGCELNNFQSYLVAFAFYISYLVVSMPAAYLLRTIGFRNGMMLGFWIMSLGAFIFVGAAASRAYIGFLSGLFTIGGGLAVLQTAANPYITVLGPVDRAAQRISIMGVCNKIAGILAPLLFAAAILRPTDDGLVKSLPLMGRIERESALTELIGRVTLPYTCVGIFLFGLGFFVRYSSLPEIETEEALPGKRNLFQFPHLVLGALAIFLHVGTQVLAVDTIIAYAGSMEMPLSEAKMFPSYTLAATIIGYFTGIICIPRYISQSRAFLVCTILGIGLSLLVVLTKGRVVIWKHTADISIWFLVLLGLANSLIWAGIWPMALHNLGRFTKAGASLLVMGLCGNAILPLLYGWLADHNGLQKAYWVLLPCYCYLFFYASYGHRIRSWAIFR